MPAGFAAEWDCGGCTAPRRNANCSSTGSRLLTPPWGLNGGYPGGRGAFRFGDDVEPFVSGSGRLSAGDKVEIITPGAGGYGAPFERASGPVERDPVRSDPQFRR